MPSSVISHINYDAAMHTLKIKFVSGIIYEYQNVPAKVFEELKTSASKGTYFNLHIKGIYDFNKLTSADKKDQRNHLS
ncbi:MAG: hypothetical protein JWM28_4091 [Chitinophagaceae bacterium]|nr:hypothetical protein [Chitinophagaceae bacterium]